MYSATYTSHHDVKAPHGIKPFLMRVPIIKLNGKGPKTVLITDLVAADEIPESGQGKLLSHSMGVVFENLLNHSPILPSEVLVINFHQFRLYSMQDKHRAYYEQKFWKSILRKIELYKPEVVVASGLEIIKMLDPNFTISRLNRITKYSSPDKRVSFNYVPTIGLFDLCTDIGSGLRDASDTTVNLMGYFLDGFETSQLGYNRYNFNTQDLKFVYVDSLKRFKKFMEILRSRNDWKVSVDTETESLNRINNRLLSIQFCLDEKTGYCIPLFHKDTPFSSDELKYIVQDLIDWFERGHSDYLIMHYGKFDLTQLYTSQIKCRFINHRLFDTAAAEFCLDENRRFLKFYKSQADIKAGIKEVKPYQLNNLAGKYGGDSLFKKLKISKNDRHDLERFDMKDFVTYGCLDVIVPWQMHKMQLKEAARRGTDYIKYKRCVIDLMGNQIHSYAAMESRGVYVDKKYLASLVTANSPFVQVIEEARLSFRKSENVIKANTLLLKKYNMPTGQGFFGKGEKWIFNPSSTPHREVLYFDVMELEPVSEGSRSSGKAFQKKHQDVFEVKLQKEWNKTTALYSNFVKKILRSLSEDPDCADGRIRTKFSYTDVITGRTSSTNPNMQNVPTREDKKAQLKLSKIIKRQFIAMMGFLYLKLDYSVHEVRKLGNASYDKALGKSFAMGRLDRQQYVLAKTEKELEEIKKRFDEISDVHRQNAKLFFNVEPIKCDPDTRTHSKTIGFSVIYGKSPKSVAGELGKPLEFAKKLFEIFFSKLPQAGKWLKDTIANARKTLVTVSPMGRVRHLWAYLHQNESMHAAMDRRGPNSYIQGWASDLGAEAARMVDVLVWEFFVSQGQPFSLGQTLAVHDSAETLVKFLDLPMAMYILHHAFTTRMHKLMRETFEFPLLIDLEVDFGIGADLANLTELLAVNSIPMMQAVKAGLEQQEKILSIKLDIPKIMADIQHNAKLIHDIRKKEVKYVMANPNKYASEYMILNPANVLSIGYRFADPMTTKKSTEKRE